MLRWLSRSFVVGLALGHLMSIPALAEELARPAAMAAPADDGNWTMPAKNYASTRFADLDQINVDNVRELQVAWTFSTGVLRGHEAPPLVVGGTMYIVTPYPNDLYALDLTKPGAPVKWRYEPKPDASAQGVACCDYVNRGPAYADGRIFFNTLDNHTIALDAASGQEIWKTKLGDINKGESMTMAPLVVKGKVLVSNSGGEFGVRGWLTARAIGEASVRTKSIDPDTLAAFLRTPEFILAGFKGQGLMFRDWDGQLRQPILIARPKLLVSVSPQPGFLHQASELDTLGHDRVRRARACPRIVAARRRAAYA